MPQCTRRLHCGIDIFESCLVNLGEHLAGTGIDVVERLVARGLAILAVDEVLDYFRHVATRRLGGGRQVLARSRRRGIVR